MRALLALIGAATLSFPSIASAWVRSRVPDVTLGPDAPCLYWTTRTIPYVQNERGSRDASGALEAARASFQTWSAPACTDLRFEDKGLTSRIDVGYDPKASDNLNLVVYREEQCTRVLDSSDPCFSTGTCANEHGCWDQAPNTIAVTTTTFLNKTGEVLDADIEMNGAGFVFTTLDSPPCPKGVPVTRPATCVATDVQNTLTHEIGHIVGLDHTEVADATMFSTADLGETLKRTLAQDDVEGECAIYPKGAEVVTCVEAPVETVGDGGCPACGSAGGGTALVGLAALSLALVRRRRA